MLTGRTVSSSSSSLAAAFAHVSGSCKSCAAGPSCINSSNVEKGHMTGATGTHAQFQSRSKQQLRHVLLPLHTNKGHRHTCCAGAASACSSCACKSCRPFRSCFSSANFCSRGRSCDSDSAITRPTSNEVEHDAGTSCRYNCLPCSTRLNTLGSTTLFVIHSMPPR